MEGEAANISMNAKEAMVDMITSGLRNTIAAEVREALQSILQWNGVILTNSKPKPHHDIIHHVIYYRDFACSNRFKGKKLSQNSLSNMKYFC